MLLSLLVALGSGGLGRGLFGRWTRAQDPAARFGLHGLLGLGFLGWITLPLGLLPSGLRWGVYPIGLLALAGLGLLARDRPRGTLPKGPAALGLLALAIAGLIALVGVLAPSDAYDWDSLAYHLAVPKLWLAAGRIEYVSYIHHSNFPFLVDNLYVWGELWGGEAGAKAFSWAYAAYGAFAIFGLARARYGGAAGWWSSVAFATVPMVLWEAGTAYVDVSHALFGGLGIWIAAGMAEGVSLLPSPPDPLSKTSHLERGSWVLPALLLGGAVGSKYTALQTLPILIAVSLVFRARPSALLKMAAVALAIGAPWYVRNVVDTGNPVYPFFYSRLGGRNWDAFQERIYKDQQQTFGAGRPMAEPYTSGPLEPSRIGSSVLGTAYSPGRYSDPGPTAGQGFPFVSLGAIPVAALLAWLVSGRARRSEGVALAVALVSFGAWFVLSQQARYAFVWCVPLVLLAGGAVARLRFGRAMAGAIALQGLLSIFVATRFGDAFPAKLRVVLGGETAEAYRAKRIAFAQPAAFLNDVAKGGRVGLFDEVFGYLLDVPYFWAGPGHTTEMGYATLRNGDEFAAALERLGITHVYFSTSTAFGGGPEGERWARAAGLAGPPEPYAGRDRAARMQDERTAYKVFLAEAVAGGRLRLLRAFGSRLVFEVVRG